MGDFNLLVMGVLDFAEFSARGFPRLGAGFGLIRHSLMPQDLRWLPLDA